MLLGDSAGLWFLAGGSEYLPDDGFDRAKVLQHPAGHVPIDS